jgi:hypothetical protein
MAADRILQNDIPGLGQSQDERAPAALDPASTPIDARGPAERIAEARRLAARLNFYDHDPAVASGSWQGLFPADAEALLDAPDGRVPPHLGLFGAFLDMLEPARAALNELGGKHLDFEYRRVLGFRPLPPQSEHAHLLLQPKKGAAPFTVTPDMRFSGGKDASGAQRLYAPAHDMRVGSGQIVACHSVHRDAAGLRFAPVADSADGLGEALDPGKPSWPPFGHAGLGPAPVGFAVASSLLRLQDGVRRITLSVHLGFLAASGLSAGDIAASLQAYVTGEKSWLGPYPLSGSAQGERVELSLALPVGEAAVVDLIPAVHGPAFATDLPVLQLRLRPERAARFAALAGLRPEHLQLEVSVDGARNLALENDFGTLNPKKAFQPFGPQPVAGSRFLVGCPQALAKPLTQLAIQLVWQGAPADLGSWYANYAQQRRIAGGVQARLVYQDASGSQTVRNLNLMQRRDGVTTLSPSASDYVAPALTEAGLAHRLFHGGSLLSRLLGRKLLHVQPGAAGEPPPLPAARAGFVTVALIEDFLHADYRSEALTQARAAQPKLLNEPYTPTVQEISLSYTARLPQTDLASSDAAAFAAAADLQFFHVGAFGARREHPFLRRDPMWIAEKRPGLLPAYPDEGEFIVGVEGLAAGDSIHLLLQVAEGSADPDLPAQPVSWSVLCDNHWRPVAADELLLDTTRGLRASGIVGIALSRWTTTGNTWLPPGRVWLKAAVRSGSGAACRLVGVHANAVEVVRVWPALVPPLVETRPPGSIDKLVAPPTGLKKVDQPYATFGGRVGESDALLRRRAAERLRHRQRCITPWDYERLLLEAFPGVHRVKCIPHASDTAWMAPGHVLIVAVPDLRNRNLPDLLQPKVDLDTLTRMAELAQAHASPQVSVHLRNPAYLPIRLDFKVRFRPGLPFDYTRQQLHAAIVRNLSPWAFETGRPLDFGGRIYRSVLLDFIEELPYVDYVTDFRCGLAGTGDLLLNDAAEIVADRPDLILVSAARHVIGEATD